MPGNNNHIVLVLLITLLVSSFNFTVAARNLNQMPSSAPQTSPLETSSQWSYVDMSSYPKFDPLPWIGPHIPCNNHSRKHRPPIHCVSDGDLA
ncbi:hypothetical protein M5689_010238 [Euphorbia peplus]|nr:hypothetical protein M5689_010238 [Euphorbia peplus]